MRHPLRSVRATTAALAATGALAACGLLATGPAVAAGGMREVQISQADMLTQAESGTVAVPAPGGGVQRFHVEPTSVMAPALERRYPSNRVFQGEGIDDPRARVMLGTGLQGFHAQVLTPAGDWYVDRLEDASYRSAARAALPPDRNPDALPPIAVDGVSPAPRALGTPLPRTSGGQLRTYRLALATTAEYSAFFGGTKPLVMAELVRAVARINGIYQAEVDAKFELVPNDDQLIYLNAGTDPYTNSDPGQLLTENQANVDTVIGNANYDLGHVFSTDGGGLAALGVLGETGQKAKGETGSSDPTGDGFWVDYVAHEMGHQMGGNHTFQGDQGNCNGNGNAFTAWEPGSGSTIMAYAGICGTDDIQAHSDAYFHAASYEEIRTEIEAKPAVGTVTNTGNTAPAVTPAVVSYTVPPRTPLRLDASGTDADGNALTFNWEQYTPSSGSVIRALSVEPKPTGALFRSLPPTASGTRYLPPLPAVLAGTTNAATGGCTFLGAGATETACWAQFLPTTARTLPFRVTARDDASPAGGVSTADIAVTVSGSTPFAVTSQPSAATLAQGAVLPVTWNTAGTTAAPFNIATVDILMSADGGSTWAHMLASGTANDGAADVTVPAVTTSNARIMVRPVGAAFYDVADGTLQVQSGGATPGPGPEPTTAPASESAAVPTPAAPGFLPDAWIQVGTRAAVGRGLIGSTTQRVTALTAAGKTVTYTVTVMNKGTSSDRFTLRGQAGTKAFAVAYRTSAGKDITRAVTKGTYVTGTVAPGATVKVTARVTVTTTAAAGTSLSRTLRATSKGDTARYDAVAFRTYRR